jgi:hypothetical protein
LDSSQQTLKELSDLKSIILNSKRGGVADECCLRSCSFEQLQNYCLYDQTNNGVSIFLYNMIYFKLMESIVPLWIFFLTGFVNMNLFIRGIRIGEVTLQTKVVSVTWFLGEFVLCYYCFMLPNLWLLLTGCYKWAVIHFLMLTNAVTVLIHSSFMTCYRIWLTNEPLKLVTRWVPHVEQELLTLPEHFSSPSVLVGFMLFDL